MILNIVMDSGKEYQVETELSLEEFVKELEPPVGVGVKYMTLAKNILINTSRVSSIEVHD